MNHIEIEAILATYSAGLNQGKSMITIGFESDGEKLEFEFSSEEFKAIFGDYQTDCLGKKYQLVGHLAKTAFVLEKVSPITEPALKAKSEIVPEQNTSDQADQVKEKQQTSDDSSSVDIKNNELNTELETKRSVILQPVPDNDVDPEKVGQPLLDQAETGLDLAKSKRPDTVAVKQPDFGSVFVSDDFLPKDDPKEVKPDDSVDFGDANDMDFSEAEVDPEDDADGELPM